MSSAQQAHAEGGGAAPDDAGCLRRSQVVPPDQDQRLAVVGAERGDGVQELVVDGRGVGVCPGRTVAVGPRECVAAAQAMRVVGHT
jgi:hypothetical protein